MGGTLGSTLQLGLAKFSMVYTPANPPTASGHAQKTLLQTWQQLTLFPVCLH